MHQWRRVGLAGHRHPSPKPAKFERADAGRNLPLPTCPSGLSRRGVDGLSPSGRPLSPWRSARRRREGHRPSLPQRLLCQNGREQPAQRRSNGTIIRPARRPGAGPSTNCHRTSSFLRLLPTRRRCAPAMSACWSGASPAAIGADADLQAQVAMPAAVTCRWSSGPDAVSWRRGMVSRNAVLHPKLAAPCENRPLHAATGFQRQATPWPQRVWRPSCLQLRLSAPTAPSC